MFNHRIDQAPSRFVVFNWFLLSFNGGCINVGGFLAAGRFVSHVTGFSTLFGVSLVSRQVDAALGILSVPIFFLLGCFIAGLFVELPIRQGRKPHFEYVMGLSAFCLFLAASAGVVFHFGSFGEVFKLKHVYALLALLCLASGLQNGAVTSATGGSVRTTHLTGLTTDFGLGLARILSFQKKELRDENRANRLRGGLIFSFILGSAAGSWLFVNYGYGGFLLSAAIATYAAWHGRKARFYF
jgi:uncharacterized membrane protein YoaK (UPF0700 family)